MPELLLTLTYEDRRKILFIKNHYNSDFINSTKFVSTPASKSNTDVVDNIIHHLLSVHLNISILTFITLLRNILNISS